MQCYKLQVIKKPTSMLIALFVVPKIHLSAVMCTWIDVSPVTTEIYPWFS